MKTWTLACVLGMAALGGARVVGDQPLVIAPVLTTAPLYNYEDAPATPDADDPAIWVNPDDPRRSLVIGTAKDAGLLVYDMTGTLRQALFPPNAPQVLPDDPASPAGIHLLPDDACADSASGETFVPAPGGKLTYTTNRTFLFRTSFELTDETDTPYPWTPCREAALEEPQSEGLVVDRKNDTLYVAFETIGIYQIPLRSSLPTLVTVGRDRLIEVVETFGQPYRAAPDDDEFECSYNAEGSPAPDDVVAPGSAANAGRHLQADAEGLALVGSIPGRALVLASSQGDSSFHFYEIARGRAAHRGVFFVEGVGETDGVHYVPGRFGRQYPLGLLVVQNGAAPEPPDTGDVNGYEFDGATQFKYVNFVDALKALFR